MTGSAIELRALTKRYGTRRGISDVNLMVGEGEVFGYLGPNGAGKSTTIRLLLGLISPTSGTARVLGEDPSCADIRRQIGYLPGTLVVRGGQRVGSLLHHFAQLRGGIEPGRIEELAERLTLDLRAPIRSLSKGNKQKLGIVQAFMHRPRLLLLDEPTSGLDPLLQRTFLQLVDEAHADGATVLLSSHVLSEVQETADRVGIIREGRIVAVERVEELRAKALRHVTATFPVAPNFDAYSRLDGLTNLSVHNTRLECDFKGVAAELLAQLARDNALDVLSVEPSLEQLFFHYYDAEPGSAPQSTANSDDIAQVVSRHAF